MGDLVTVPLKLTDVLIEALLDFGDRGSRLLAEPPRDASGYRRYDAQDVIDLVADLDVL